MSEHKPPPPIIDSAKLLEYAYVEPDVQYTDRICLFVAGGKLGAVPCLAICRNYHQPDDVLLFFCDADWNTEGCIPFKTTEEAKLKAERGYTGITSNWQPSPHDDAAIADFLREVYEVDPSSEWWMRRCSFCQKEVEEKCISIAGATICVACVDKFHDAMHSDA